jgi:hypothetical protein
LPEEASIEQKKIAGVSTAKEALKINKYIYNFGKKKKKKKKEMKKKANVEQTDSEDGFEDRRLVHGGIRSNT